MLKENKNTLTLFKFFFKSYPRETSLVIISLLLAGVAETLGIGALLPLITFIVDTENTTDNPLANAIFSIYSFLHISPTLLNILITITLLISLKATAIFFAMRYVSYVSADITRDLRIKLIGALINAKWRHFVGLALGKIANTISMEASRAGHCYMSGGRAFSALIQSVIYVVIAFIVSWQVSLVAIIMGASVAFFIRGFITQARKAGNDLTVNMNEMVNQLNESLSGIKPLKAMGYSQNYVNHLDRHTTSVMHAQKQLSVSALLLQIIYEPIAVLMLSAGLFYVLTYTETSVEAVILLAFLFYRMMTHVNLLQNFYQNVAQNEAAVWGILDKIEAASTEKEILIEADEPTFNNNITLKNIEIAYHNQTPIFSNLSAEIPKNKITAIFGPSGSGKTSIIDALLGLIDIQKGQIYIDNKSIDKIDVKKWREKVGYVPQETFLFHDTIIENITLGNSKLSEDDVWSALEKSGAATFVRKLPNQVNHVVGERGGALSGGQRQRLAIARAIVQNPNLLVLDESTSGLDYDTESKILSTLKKLSGNITIIIISHDRKILSYADNVITLETEKNYEKNRK